MSPIRAVSGGVACNERKRPRPSRCEAGRLGRKKFWTRVLIVSSRYPTVEHMFDMKDVEATAADDPASRMKVDIAELAVEERDDWTAQALSERLVELLEVRERLNAELARVGAAWQRKRAWESDGALSPVVWLKHNAPVSGASARTLIKAARVVEAAPSLAKSLRSGRTTAAHLEALARVVSPRREPLVGEHAEVLAKQAERLSIKDFTLVARRWATIADDFLAGDTHDEDRPRNELHAAVTMDGWVDGKFRLDPATGATVLSVLDHLAPPDPVESPDGVRSLAERRGDALAELAGWYHDRAEPGANPPNLDIVVDVATLNGTTPELAKARCDLEGIGPITKAALAQFGCSAPAATRHSWRVCDPRYGP